MDVYIDLEWSVTAIQEARYAIAAVYGLQLYEWINGLDKEIKLICRARWTSIKFMYLLCRYYPLLCWPIVMWAYLDDHSFETCSKIGRPIHILLAPCQFFSQAVMLMRAYAFTGRNQRIAILLGLCYTALLSIDIWTFVTHIYLPPEIFYVLIGPSGCFPNYGSSVMATRLGLSMLAATLMDLVSLVFVLIYCKRESSFHGGSLASYFCKQGLTSFIAVTFVNIASAVAFFKPPSYHSGIGLPLSLVLPNLVACRVILQLRRRVAPTPTEISRINSLLVDAALQNSDTDEDSEQDIWLMRTEKIHRSLPPHHYS